MPTRRQSKPTVEGVDDTKKTSSKKQTTNEESWLVKAKRIAFSPRFKFGLGIALAFIFVYLTIAFVSYFFSGSTDFSILEQEVIDKASRQEIRNTAGFVGAALAHGIIQNGFGIAAICLVALIGYLAYLLLREGSKCKWRILFTAAFGLIWGSAALAFVQSAIASKAFFFWGGKAGKWACDEACSYVSVVGTFFILLVALLVFFICVDRNTVPNLKRFGNWILSLFAKKEQPAEDENADSIDDQFADDNLPAEVAPDGVQVGTDEEGGFVVNFGDDVQPTEKENTNTDTPFVINPTEGEEPASEGQEDGEEDGEGSQEPAEGDDGGGESDPENGEEGEPEEGEVPLKVEEVNIEEMLKRDPEYLFKKLGPYDPRADLSSYQFPSIKLLKEYPNENSPQIDMEEQTANKNRIVNTFRSFGIEIVSIKATIGPTVTLYEIVPKDGTRIAKIQGLEKDIMLSLSANGIRMIAPMPGKGTVGIEVPNKNAQVVSMHSVVASKRFQEEQKMRLPVVMGKTITNEIFMFDLAKTPHLLVAGATGQGKSVGLNAILTSLLYKKHPGELKLVLVDPKMVEFTLYKPLLRHYMAAMPDQDDIIITDCQKVINTLNSLVIEMENRYTLLMDANCRNLEDYNEKFVHRRLNPAKDVFTNDHKCLHHQYLPYIVIVIDEFGDFIMQAGKEVERPIARITQKARAVGMHMILATQRPSVNIITGVIKANIPTRIAFRCQSVTDSRTILDAKGADQLVGKGDMLYSGGNGATRIQCAFVDTPEVEVIVDHIKNQQAYAGPYELPEYVPEGADGEDGPAPGEVDTKHLDPMFADVARYVVSSGQGSTSILQRKFQIGYNRAGKLSDQLEATGIVGPGNGPKGREVLVRDEMQLRMIFESLGIS